MTFKVAADFTPSDLIAAIYSKIFVQIYYYQLAFPVAGVTRNVRIYMSSEPPRGKPRGIIKFNSEGGTTTNRGRNLCSSRCFR